MKTIKFLFLLLLISCNSYALDKVSFDPLYIPNPNTSKALSLAKLYIGNPNSDPSITGNQKTVFALQQSGAQVAISQPIITSAGGVPLYNGSPVSLWVDGDYSLKVTTSAGVQTFYTPNAGFSADSIKYFGSVADLKAYPSLQVGSIYGTSGYYTPGDNGGGTYLIKTADDFGSTPDGYCNHWADSGHTKVAVVDYDSVLNAKKCGYQPGVPSKGTVPIQSAIDLLYSKSQKGTVLIEGQASLVASVLGETYYNTDNTSTIPVISSTGCLVARPGVTIKGNGINGTELVGQITKSVIIVPGGNYVTIEDMTINGSDTTAAAGAGHGIIQWLSTTDINEEVRGLNIRRVKVKDVGSYGIGLENGKFIGGNFIEDVIIDNVGADGIDTKNRASDSIAVGLKIDGAYITRIGRRLDGEAGIDIRGVINVSNVQVRELGRSGVSQFGIRTRTLGPDQPDAWGRRSTISDVYIESYDEADEGVTGIFLGSAQSKVVNASIEKCWNGVDLGANGDGAANNSAITNVTAYHSGGNGFAVSVATVTNSAFINCRAIGCDTGFYNVGIATQYIGCAAPNSSTAETYVGSTAVLTEQRTGNLFGGDYITQRFVTEGEVEQRAIGGSDNISYGIRGKGTGVLKIHTVVSDYADNTAAKAAGLVNGDVYRTVDALKIVH